MSDRPAVFHPLHVSPVGSLVVIRHATAAEFGYVTEVTPLTVTVVLNRTPTFPGDLHILTLEEWFLITPNYPLDLRVGPVGFTGDAVAVFIERTLL